MHAKMAARVTTLTAVISVCVLMAGLGMTAVRILMTVPVLPATKGPPVMTGWRRLSVNVLLGAQVYFTPLFNLASDVLFNWSKNK